MSDRQLSPNQINRVRQDIELLLRTYPELQEDEVLRADCIEGETEAFSLLRKIEAKRRDATAMAGAIGTTIAEMELRQGRYERREQTLRVLMHKMLDTCDLRKVELPEATVSILRSPPKVVIVEEADIPEAYIRIKKEPDKQKIGAALKSGEAVPGCALSNQPETISIRTR